MRPICHYPPLAPLPAPRLWCRMGWHWWRSVTVYTGASTTSAGKELGTGKQCAWCLRLSPEAVKELRP